MGKKIWSSLLPGNFGSDKIVRSYVRPPLHVSGSEMGHLLARSLRYILSVFHLVSGIHVMVN